MTTPTTSNPTPATDATDDAARADRHLALALAAQAAGRSSSAIERALQLLREDVDKLQAIVARFAPPPPSPPTERRPRRPIPCPCALGGLWAGVPRRLRRHAVLCKLWTPPASSEASR